MKTNQKYKIFLLFLMLCLFPILSLASEELVLPQYTEEYKNWLELSEEEKQNLIEPQAYESVVQDEEIQPFSEDINTNVSASNLPQKYQRSYYGKVKNQGGSNACWVYSAVSMFDTNYYLSNHLTKKSFSNLHMDYATSYQYNQNGFNRRVDSGGNVQIALAYATNGMGIPLESAMPTTINSSTIGNVAKDAKVNDYIKLQGQNEIKNYLYNYGVVPVFTYSYGDSYFSDSNLYNNSNLAYCCTNANQSANHAVTLIGWDDHYTNANFPGRQGAYIVLNSYGTAFGNNGLYYIFYDDTFVGGITYGVTNTTDINYDYLYQHDPYGCIAEGGYRTGTYAANVFTRENPNYTEKLTEVSSYFPEAGNVTIYINANDSDVRTSSATKVMNTYISQPGYHTIKLNQEILLKNSKFVIGIKYPGVMSAEIPTSSGWCSTVTSNFGESYLSNDGRNYADMQQVYSSYRYANACIKGFTQKTNQIAVKEYSDDLPNYVFNARYYADHNPDLYIAFGYDETALRNHWNIFGKAEGRASSSIFNVKYYVSENPDLLKAFGHDYIALYHHFMNSGYGEYRKSSPEYDGNYYKNHNTDLKDMTSMELIRHYSLFGKNELRRANTNYDITNFLFDAQIYANCNPDVVNAFGNNEYLLKTHWYQYGIAEGRIASFLFDAKYYLSNNEDLRKAFSSTNYVAAYEHFISNGFAEERQANVIFSATYYLDQNSDLKKAFGNNNLSAVNHFVIFGKKEGRIASSTFNVITYRLKNVDLRKAFQENYEQYLIHYFQFGQYENRTCL